jgi:hypothetical protein
LAAFFMPWLSVASGQVSAYDLATRPVALQALTGTQPAAAEALLWPVVVAALAVLACAFRVRRRVGAAASVTGVSSATLLLLLLLASWVAAEGYPSRSTPVAFQVGAWLTVVGLAHAVAASVVALMNASSEDKAEAATLIRWLGYLNRLPWWDA